MLVLRRSVDEKKNLFENLRLRHRIKRIGRMDGRTDGRLHRSRSVSPEPKPLSVGQPHARQARQRSRPIFVPTRHRVQLVPRNDESEFAGQRLAASVFVQEGRRHGYRSIGRQSSRRPPMPLLPLLPMRRRPPPRRIIIFFAG